MTLLHRATGHLSTSSAIEAFSSWQNIPEWVAKTLYSKFLHTSHRLLCEMFRRRMQQPSGSGIFEQIVAHTMSYDYKTFRIPTIYGSIGFYIFLCATSGGFLVYLVKDKSAKQLVHCLKNLSTWLGQYGHRLVTLRQDAGSTENSQEVKEALSEFPINIDNSASASSESQAANPVERFIQAYMIMVLTLMNSTSNFGPGDWGLSIIAAAYHFASTISEKKDFLSQGTSS